ncbi:potassium translocating ATPase, subunit A [uncultured Alphaproteobacteria bacterium]|uniref:Potassium-transporting ATPase potassium-binding subunit n=1 Tax=uncultured Alphaproteobacteria bacterium TaxID=91750 RepID=A0A212JZ70_9PROT|nr:potassium translocating ATPase, subunit A [uncultured Alphaproteobacteria bacterium]
MDATGILQILVYLALIAALTPVVGGYLARIFDGRAQWLARVERPVYRLCGVSPEREQHWSAYALSLLAFNLAGALQLYGLLRLQTWLPLNPEGMAAASPRLAFNTSVSFVTNTNWQAYGGETALGYFVQMTGMTVQNFASAATGIAVAAALIRGFSRRSAKTVGHFVVDVTRVTLYLLLPACFAGALLLVWLGVPQNFDSYTVATTLEGARQTIAQGPVASQMFIKHLGTNGGGFFNANAAHPFETPSALVNLIHMLAIFAIGAGLTNAFGRMVGDVRQGWAILGAMALLFVAGVFALWAADAAANPAFAGLGVDQAASPWQPGGNMEGKEVRFGIAASALFAAVTTAASCGAVVAMHDSLMPLAGMVPLVNILLGEVVVGGVGAGLCGMLMFAVVAVFVAGLMVGRTPEYLGKKIEAREIKLAVLAILVLPVGVLGFGALGMAFGAGAIQDPGPHGLSELLYAYASATGNNGSAFAGFGADTTLHDTLLGLAMGLGRYAAIVPVLALAGAAAAKPRVPDSAGTFPTSGGLFVGLLAAVVLVVGGLTFFPVLALGPLAEQFALAAAVLY